MGLWTRLFGKREKDLPEFKNPPPPPPSKEERLIDHGADKGGLIDTRHAGGLGEVMEEEPIVEHKEVAPRGATAMVQNLNPKYNHGTYRDERGKFRSINK